MRSSPTNNNNTLLKIQQEISEVAARETELRNFYQRQRNASESSDHTATTNGASSSINDLSNASNSPASSPSPPITSQSPPTFSTSSPPPPPPPALKTHAVNGAANAVNNNNINNSGNISNSKTKRLFTPNQNIATKGVMQKFFKSRGKFFSVASTFSNNNNNNNNTSAQTTIRNNNNTNWQSIHVIEQPSKALIPADKPLRKGYVPVEEKIQKELRDFKQREDELRIERRKSQPDLMAALEREQDEILDTRDTSLSTSQSTSRCSSPAPMPGRLRNSRSFSQLLEEEFNDDNHNQSLPGTRVLKPARSLAELCDISDDEMIKKPRNLIEQWESRIRQSQESNN